VHVKTAEWLEVAFRHSEYRVIRGVVSAQKRMHVLLTDFPQTLRRVSDVTVL